MNRLSIQDHVARVKERKAKRRERKRDLAALTPARPGQVTTATSSYLEAALDAIFSAYIRTRDARITGGLCFICRVNPITDCFHWIRRGHHSVRWDVENACGSCGKCNALETVRRPYYRDVFISLFGLDKRIALEFKARQASDFSTADLKAMLDDFKNKLEGVWIGGNETKHHEPESGDHQAAGRGRGAEGHPSGDESLVGSRGLRRGPAGQAPGSPCGSCEDEAPAAMTAEDRVALVRKQAAINHSFPGSGFCFSCHADIFADPGSAALARTGQLVTGCPMCHRSFFD